MSFDSHILSQINYELSGSDRDVSSAGSHSGDGADLDTTMSKKKNKNSVGTFMLVQSRDPQALLANLRKTLEMYAEARLGEAEQSEG